MRKVDCSRAKSLKDAVELCRRVLIDGGRKDYAALIDETRVRAAVKTGLEKCRHALDKRSMPYGADYPWALDKEVEKQIRHFEDVVKPVYLNIADGGAWPPGASFNYILFRQDDNLVRYDCFCLDLHIETPGTMFVGFALPVLTLYYGGVPPRSEDDDE